MIDDSRAAVSESRGGYRRWDSASSPRTSPRREGLRGYVTNLPDGRVEASVEGDRESVERFERAIHNGPPGARVTTVDVESAPVGEFTEFHIRM